MDNIAHIILAELRRRRVLVSRSAPDAQSLPSRRSRRRGAAAVELAIAAPLLFLLIFGMIEVGRLVMVRQALTNAARVGCRKAALATTADSQDTQTAVRNYLQSVIPNASSPEKVSVSVDPASLSGVATGTPITVEVGVNFSDVSWVPSDFVNFGDALVLSGRSTHRRE